MSARSDKYKPFDVADHLVDLDDIAGYLELAIEESADDPSAVPRLRGHRPHTEHERARSTCRHEPRRPLQSTLR